MCMPISHLDCELCKARDPVWNVSIYDSMVGTQHALREWMMSLACIFFAQFNMCWNFHARAVTGQMENLGQLRQKWTFRVLPEPPWFITVAFCTLRTAWEGISTKSHHTLAPGEKDSPGGCIQAYQSADTSIHSPSAIAFHEPLLKTCFQNSGGCHHQDVNNSEKDSPGTDPSVDKTSKRIGEAWQISGKGKTEPPNRAGQSKDYWERDVPLTVQQEERI